MSHPEPLSHYILHYHDKDDESLYFRCWAESPEHAREQLEDHERTVSGGILFWEVLEVSR